MPRPKRYATVAEQPSKAAHYPRGHRVIPDIATQRCATCGRPINIGSKKNSTWWGHTRTRPSLDESFLARTPPPRGEDCQEWLGYRNGYGYGVIRHKGNTVMAHRYALERVAPIPDGLQALHHCDNPPCVRPDHLFVGTDADNVRDKIAKGRGARGEMVGSAKLTENDVRTIRACPDESHASLGRRFGVSWSTIRLIRIGRNWKHVQ